VAGVVERQGRLPAASHRARRDRGRLAIILPVQDAPAPRREFLVGTPASASRITHSRKSIEYALAIGTSDPQEDHGRVLAASEKTF
jgi:hypothetical protein